MYIDILYSVYRYSACGFMMWFKTGCLCLKQTVKVGLSSGTDPESARVARVAQNRQKIIISRSIKESSNKIISSRYLENVHISHYKCSPQRISALNLLSLVYMAGC